ncbi:trypsin-like peptidase domain-containing protein [candidate division WOR-3 bacterium]|uniref:Trypsin-like peptidase domain-containing protein n=1 Tax=candidate division WOR-3 bacterium TaxID=2052148 RepID=A0A938BTE2_UNCW3|nr:trypsin-like peptidase domain-containing protein [candidate division WOR-3 bacterium]
MNSAHNSQNHMSVPLCSAFCVLAFCTQAFPQGALHPSNLDYPVMISVAGRTGTGFFVTDSDSVHWYLVTARHVLFKDTAARHLWGPSAMVSGYAAGQRYEFQANLDSLLTDGLLKADTGHDVAVARCGTLSFKSEGGVCTWYRRHLRRSVGGKLRITVVKWDMLRTYDQVLVGNDVFVFGFPRNLGLRGLPEIDSDRPLVHKGIVAGSNPSMRTLIIDAAVYPGNSGGPVIEVEEGDLPFNDTFVLIGVVTEYVPFEDVWHDITRDYMNRTISTSDYSIVEPMDPVIDIIQKWRKK